MGRNGQVTMLGLGHKMVKASTVVAVIPKKASK